jgi:hypothetical protein
MENELKLLEEIINSNPKRSTPKSEERQKVVLFVSFDLYNSAELKTQTKNWKEIMDIFFENEFQNMTLWKFNGDELLYKRETLSIPYICDIIREVHDHVLALHTKFKDQLSLSIYVKATIWIALTNDEIDKKEIINNYRLKVNGIEDFIGKNIDEGFRLTKYSSSQKVAIDPKIIFMLALLCNIYKGKCIDHLLKEIDSVLKKEVIEFTQKLKEANDGTIKERLETIKGVLDNVVKIGYVKFKGIWNNRMYPVFWYYREDRGYCVQYDEMFNDKLVKEISEVKNRTINKDVCPEDVYKRIDEYLTELTRVFVQVGTINETYEIVKKLSFIIEPKLGNEKLRAIYHYAIICVDKENERIMISKRGTGNKYPNGVWGFGSIDVQFIAETKDVLQKQYRNSYGVEIDLCYDEKMEYNPIVLGMYSVNDGNNVHNWIFYCATIKQESLIKNDIIPNYENKIVKYAKMSEIKKYDELSKDDMERYYRFGIYNNDIYDNKSIAFFKNLAEKAFAFVQTRCINFRYFEER